MKCLFLLIFSVLFSLSVNAQLIISGVMGDPVGQDAPPAGKDVLGIDHKGGYEYIQLLATENIDFSKNHYALVISRNSSKRKVTAKGWAEGKGMTYKINLTSGKVKKGQFFYVGGADKVIAGYSETLKAKSTYIGEDAKEKENRGLWIVGKIISAPGDDFGNAPLQSSGLMPNGKSNPYGIAVFQGTKVTASSVPLDAVYFGKMSVSDIIINGTYGYLTPDKSDLYDAKGGEQKYFAQGTNTKLFPFQKETEKGNFAKFSGVYNAKTKTWEVPRKMVYVSLAPKARVAVSNAHLSDIESGEVVKIKN